MKTAYSFKSKLPDLSGVCFSSLCALHCLAMPSISVLLVIPEGSIHWVHPLMIGIGLPLMIISVRDNQRKSVSWAVSALLVSGWMLFVCGEYFMGEEHEVMQVVAGFLICAGHLIGGWLKRMVAPG